MSFRAQSRPDCYPIFHSMSFRAQSLLDCYPISHSMSFRAQSRPDCYPNSEINRSSDTIIGWCFYLITTKLLFFSTTDKKTGRSYGDLLGEWIASFISPEKV